MALEQIIDTKHLVFDSSHGSPGSTPTDFTVHFNNNHYAQGYVISLLPVDIIIPNYFNNVTASTQRITIFDGVSNVVIDMPLGFYSVETFMEEFTAQLAATASLVTVASWMVDPVTGKLTIEMSGPWSYDGSLSTANYLLGADGSIAIGANSLEMPFPTNFSGEQAVIVETSINSSNTSLAYEDRQITMLDYISLVDTCFGHVKHQTIQTDHARAFAFTGDTSIREMRIRLLNSNGDALELPANCKTYLHLLAMYGSPL